ncbi:MAG: ATP-binding cassette domain-containing protein [Alphaproteobacteria bacterium]
MHGKAAILPLKLLDVSFEIGGKRLIDGISAEFNGGLRTVILGPNGAGKSLLLRLCHGLLTPSTGSVTWSDPDRNHAARRQVMVFQRPVMLRRSAAANIEYALSLRGIGRRERRARVAEALEKTGLSALAGRQARVLSIGEQQRLALARAWALAPEVMFLDEPTASLDPAASRAVERIIDAFHETGAKIVMTTHDLGQARRIADEVLFIHHGKLVERTDAATFFKQPKTEEADAFMRGELHW